MSNLSEQTLTLLNTAEIVENERPIKLSPLQWSKFKRQLVLTLHSAGFQKSPKINPGKK
jgi:hypothetical protein